MYLLKFKSIKTLLNFVRRSSQTSALKVIIIYLPTLRPEGLKVFSSSIICTTHSFLSHSLITISKGFPPHCWSSLLDDTQMLSTPVFYTPVMTLNVTDHPPVQLLSGYYIVVFPRCEKILIVIPYCFPNKYHTPIRHIPDKNELIYLIYSWI